jgi:hypothetical protein
MKKLARHWVEHRSGLNLPFPGHWLTRHRGNTDRIVRVVIEKVDGAINRVNHPGNPGAGITGLTLFAHETIPWTQFPKPLMQERF